MKKITSILALVLLSATTTHAVGIKAGLHGAYNMGGDIEESAFGFGANASIDLPGPLAGEASVTRFKWDVSDDIDSDVSVIILSASIQAGMELGDLFYGYVGGGMSYNMWDEPLDSRTGYHLCVGAEAGLAILEVFGDYSYTFSKIEMGGVFGSANIQYGVARVGARYRF